MSYRHCYALALAFLIAMVAAVPGTAQDTGEIEGVVTDSVSGTPLPGVNVVVAGTNQGAATGTEGEYAISGVPAGTHRLQISFVGYEDKIAEGVQIRAGETTTVDIALVESALQMDEVVTVGYSTQRGEDLTGSISSVNAEDFESLPVTGADEALTGQIAGVQISEGSGMPGGGPSIQVRGTGSIGADTNPLYVVDGFALPTSTNQISNPINDIPPQDIESITVLKDASATAIYGSRGSNGVILIETKEGSAGAPSVNVRSSMGMQQIPSGQVPEMLSAQEFAQFRKEFHEGQVRYEEGREPTSADIPEDYRNPDELGAGTDWPDEVTQVAPTRQFDVSVRGGNESVRSYFSAGYRSEEGVVKGTSYERFSLRANASADLTERIEMGVRLSPTFSQREQQTTGGDKRYDRFGNALVSSPLAPVYNEDGSYNPMLQSDNTFAYPNPLLAIDEIKDDRESLRAIGSVFATIEPVDWLTYESTFNVDWQDTEIQTFHPSTVGFENQGPPVTPSGNFTRDKSLNWESQNTLSYDLTVGEDHSIDGVFGVTAQRDQGSWGGFTGDEFPGNEIQTLNAAPEISGSTSIEEWSLLSLLSRLNYSYQNKYLLTATVRRDGSSRFGADNQWGTFPSLAVGWRLSEEPFLQDVGSIDDMKLRLSYGENGNFNIGNYTWAGQVGINNYVLGGGLANGRTVNTLGNSLLGWESSREYNAGLDLSMLESRVVVTVDVYRRITEDMLLNVEIPQSSGFSSVTENRGKIRNQGLEVAVQTQNVDGEDVSWETDFNVSTNENEVRALGPDDEPILSGAMNGARNTNITQVGSPVGMFYGWVIDGVYESEEEIENSPSYDGAIPGNIKPRDVGGDGELSRGDDFTTIGSPYPDFTFGITNTVRYKNIDLRVLMNGSYGGERLRGSNEYLWNIDGVFNVTEEYFENRWRSQENPGDGETPTAVGPSEARVIYRDPSTLAVQDNSHLRVKNVTLGYRIPSNWMGSTLQRARIYGSIQNALLITGYEGGNPEATNYNTPGVGATGNPRLVPGIDYSSYPVPRTYSIGVEIGF